MYEVLIESDLTVFVCPCGAQFGEETNLYHHVRLVHKESVFKPLQAMLNCDALILRMQMLSEFGSVELN